MGPGFLSDTNIVIAALDNQLPPAGVAFIKPLPPDISIITQIELLGWYGAAPEKLAPLANFVNKATIYPLTTAIATQAIALRQSHKIKTPDAIIAATALVHDLTLITRNIADFQQIPGLQLINPFAL
jgi:predicted nucleic acid-binding protein